MDKTEGFYTMKGYQRQGDIKMTSAMEDYLEMIARLFAGGRPVKVCNLSRMLHVKPSSATKMVRQLCEAGYLTAEKYGDIELTAKGQELGSYLLYRHDVLERFLRRLNQTEDELEQVEKIEHFLSRSTIENLDALAERLKGY